MKDYDYMYHILTPGLTMELVKLSKKLPNIIRSYNVSNPVEILKLNDLGLLSPDIPVAGIELL
ncbi:MAG: hypothetical protein LM567_06525 [Desulfurococcaceae archaeon]|nr:hypothetical protein [Desulfurococcaceae archaeon]